MSSPQPSGSYQPYNSPMPSETSQSGLQPGARSESMSQNAGPGRTAAPLAGSPLDEHLEQQRLKRRRRCRILGLLALLTAIVLLAIFLPLGLTKWRHSSMSPDNTSGRSGIAGIGDPSDPQAVQGGNGTSSNTAGSVSSSSSSSSSSTGASSSTSNGAGAGNSNGAGGVVGGSTNTDSTNNGNTNTGSNAGTVTTPTNPVPLPGATLQSIPADVTNVRIQLPMPVRGVNLGGWLVQESWINPGLFDYCVQQTGQVPKDEYSLTSFLGKTKALALLQPHWDTFVQEADIAALAKSGINFLRIPVGHFMLSILDGEPWVSGATSYEDAISKREGTMVYYLFRALYWAKKYNLAVVVDLHTMPGSQNGFDNSGRIGDMLWTQPANMARSITVVQQLTDLLTSDPELAGTIVGIELVNEPFLNVPMPDLLNFYETCIAYIRGSTKMQPATLAQDLYIWVEDGFRDKLNLYKYGKAPFNRIMYDAHNYQIFSNIFYTWPYAQHVQFVCDSTMRDYFYMGGANMTIGTVVGEWSMAITDCTPNINGYQKGNRQNGTFGDNGPVYGTCNGYNSASYDVMTDGDKAALRQYAETQMNAYESASGWVFWNFKTENKLPQWDWLEGVKQGVIPQPLGTFNYTCKDAIVWK